MVWYLLLAHFLGDFVLQTDWMVRNRDHIRVLSLHASIHFLLMFLLVGPSRMVVWPYLLLLAVAHLCQDRIKNNITNHRPEWIKVSFIIDQAFHFLAIWIVVWWIQQEISFVANPERPELAIIAITYLFITYVWFIIERVFNMTNREYLDNINNTKFSRMLTRVGLVSIFIMIRVWASSGIALVFSNPYAQKKFRQRAILTDIGVTLLAMFFLSWALG